MGIVLIVILFWLLIEHKDQRPWDNRSSSRLSSVEILKERYARGEISRDAYLEALRLIR